MKELMIAVVKNLFELLKILYNLLFQLKKY